MLQRKLVDWNVKVRYHFEEHNSYVKENRNEKIQLFFVKSA